MRSQFGHYARSMKISDLGSTTGWASDSNALDGVGTGEALEDETGLTFPLDPFDGGLDLHVVDEDYV